MTASSSAQAVCSVDNMTASTSAQAVCSVDKKLSVCLIVLCLCRDVNKKLLDDKDEAEAIEARRVQMLTSFRNFFFFLIQEHLKIPLCVCVTAVSM